MPNELTTTEPAPAALLFDPTRMQSLMTFADMMAKSSVTVPDHLKGKPADCMAIAMQSMQWGMNPFAVAQKTHIVSGRLGYEAQLVNAVVQQSNAIRGAFSYEYRGEGPMIECRVGAVLRGATEITWGEWLNASTVTTKNSPLWKVNPKQQMSYLQVKNWARLYCPGAILGVYTPDELEAAPPPANKDMGLADVVQLAAKPALPDYPEADFTKNLPAWIKVVESGKKSAADLLAMLSTKATFSEAQRSRILGLLPFKKDEQADAPEPEPEVDPFVSDMEAAEDQQ